MTEKYWQNYKRNKKASENPLFNEIESELKRKFKSEKTPEEMYTLCKTDNNYWKHYRWSENLDQDSISLVLCKDVGCDLMYCQALTAKGKDNLYGCKEQYNKFRDCYIYEKRKFNASYPDENEWLNNRNIIPEYIDAQLKILKEQKSRIEKIDDVKIIKINENKLITVPKEMKQKDGYF